MTEVLAVGDIAPKFMLANEEGRIVKSDRFKRSWLVLYFYPKDDTPGCTLEAKSFSKEAARISKLGAKIVGISPDSTGSHKRFASKHKLEIILLSDPSHKTIEEWGVWQRKKIYGQEYFGVIRTTFIIAPGGIIAKIWKGVEVNGHVQEVIDSIKELKESGKY